MRINSRTLMCATLLAAVALSVSCSDDESSNPMTAAADEIVLATITGSGSSSGPEEPLQPYAMIIELGVDDQVLPSYAVLPEPLLLSDRTFGDDTNIIFRHWGARDFEFLADRLTDGEDNTAYWARRNLRGGGSSSWALESQIFTYAPGLYRVGPDLIGYTVTGLQVELDIEVTQNGPTWTQSYIFAVTILGH